MISGCSSAPRIAAESLRIVAEPIATIAGRMDARHAADIHRAIAVAWRPARTAEQPPRYLRPGQIDSWRRLVAALRGFGSAVLAEPAGTGKTWIAIAAVSMLHDRFDVVAPAALEWQWRDAARATGAVPPRFLSFERASRGHVLPGRPRPVIVDEAHRLRNRTTRRFATLAPWLADRVSIFATATPIVRSPRDLTTLIRLGCRDDILAMDGIPSIAALADGAPPPPALRRLVIRSDRVPLLPAVSASGPLPAACDDRLGGRIVEAVDRLAIDAAPGIRRLVRSVMLDAAASSGAALGSVLQRYRAMLEHAREAGGIPRRDIRLLAGPLLDQTVLWPMITGDRDCPLPLQDLALLDGLAGLVPDDGPWVEALGRLLEDREPTVCFTRYLATARLLRDALPVPVAWLTGSGAGIGPRRLPRSRVTACFGIHHEAVDRYRPAPPALIATELAEEGLNLQRARRVVHLDLPWTAMQREQRLGRIRRLGQTARTVTEISRSVPGPIENSLGRESLLRRRSRSAAEWIGAIATADPPFWKLTGSRVTMVKAADGGWRSLAVVSLAAGTRTGTMILLDEGSGYRPVTPAVASSLLRGSTPLPWRGPADEIPMIREAAVAAVRTSSPPAPCTAGLAARISALGRQLARQRDAAGVDRMDRLLLAARTPGTLGHELRLAGLREVPDNRLASLEIASPPQEDRPVVAAVLLIVPSRGRYLQE